MIWAETLGCIHGGVDNDGDGDGDGCGDGDCYDSDDGDHDDDDDDDGKHDKDNEQYSSTNISSKHEQDLPQAKGYVALRGTIPGNPRHNFCSTKTIDSPSAPI